MRSFLSSLFAGSRGREPERDLSFGLLSCHGIPALVRARHWEQVAAVAATLTSDELSRLLDGLCLTEQYSQELYQLRADAPTEFGQLVLGAWHLYGAWQARTGKWGKDLTQAEVSGFVHYLQLAHEQLSGPFPTPAYRCEARARLVRVEMGFSDADAAVESFHESVALDPGKFWAHHHLFKVASPKWLGSQPELLGYIESVAEPQVQYALWLMYLVEMYSDADTEDEATAQSRWYAAHRELLQRVLAQPPLPVDNSLVAVYANNYLACLYHLLGERARRDALLEQLAPRFTPYPWAYLGIESERDEVMHRLRGSAALPRP
ncbi:hypothetical protein GCM10027048_33890 [Hymenobacter coalescens]